MSESKGFSDLEGPGEEAVWWGPGRGQRLVLLSRGWYLGLLGDWGGASLDRTVHVPFHSQFL